MSGRGRGPEKADGLICKWQADDLENIDCYESWLADLAAAGLFLDHLGDGFTDGHKAYFRRGAPRQTRYRIDVRAQKLTEDDLALYDSCGWHYVDKKAVDNYGVNNPGDLGFYIFQTDENAAVPELHTDPMEQAESLRILNKNCRDELAVTVGSVAFAVVFLKRIWETLYHGGLGLILLLYPYLLVRAVRRLYNVRRLRRRLALGEPLDHRADYRAARRNHLLVEGAYLGLRWGTLAFCVITLVTTLANIYLA